MMSRAAICRVAYMMMNSAAANRLHCTTRNRAGLHFAASLAAFGRRACALPPAFCLVKDSFVICLSDLQKYLMLAALN
jgi:hypothetical protein